MTSEEVINTIKFGISLITKAHSEYMATHHESFTRGELSMAARIGIINSQTFNDLWNEIDAAIKECKSKDSKVKKCLK